MNDREAIARRVQRAANAARSLLEGVLLGLRELPYGAPRVALAEELEGVLADLSVLASLEPEHETYFPTLDRVVAALGRLGQRLATLGEAAPVVSTRERVTSSEKALRALREASIDALVALQDRRLRAATTAEEAALRPAFCASRASPSRSVRLEGPPRVLVELAPKVDAEDELDEEDVLEEEIGDLLRVVPPTDEEGSLVFEHCRATTRDSLADLATLALLREPPPTAPWTQAAPFERRLLAHLDALFALAFEAPRLPRAFNLYEEVQRWAREAPTLDLGRERVRALLFASTDGDHALRAVLLALKQADPSAHVAYRQGFVLSGNPALPSMMRELLAESDTTFSLFALDVLSAVRAVTVADVAAFSSHGEPALRKASATALGLCLDHAAAVGLLRDCLEEETDSLVGVALARALVRHRKTEGLAWARARLEDPDIDQRLELRLGCLEIVALCGGPMDEENVLAALGVSTRDVEVAGLFGTPSLVLEIIDTLGSANRVRRATGPWVHPLELACAEALHRITGQPLRDPTPEVSDYDHQTSPAIAAEVWGEWWFRARESFAPGKKYRFGKLWEPRLTLEELAGDSPCGRRPDLAFELAVSVGEARLDVTDWVGRQQEELAAIRSRLGPWEVGAYPASVLERG